MSVQSTQVQTPSQAVGIGPTCVEEAIELLVECAGAGRDEAGGTWTDIGRAESLLRSEFHSMQMLQGQLAEALIASQDRIHAMEVLAQINGPGIASGETIGLILERALTLTQAALVLFLHADVVVTAVGDRALVDSCVELVRTGIAESPEVPLRSLAGDTVMVGALRTDSVEPRSVVFLRPPDRPFSTVDIPLVESIVSVVRVRLAFNELHQRELEQAAIEREHHLASALAQSVIEDLPPKSTTLDVAAQTIPAAVTGGDFYVFGKADGEIWFAVGDVTGKGLPAAMLMTRAVAACRVAFLAHRDLSVVDVFARIEDELFEHLDEAGVFITLAVGVAGERDRVVSLVNAGHSPIVVVGAAGARFIPASVPPVGVIRHRVPLVVSMNLDCEDAVILGSDGLAEQRGAQGELFGYERFRTLCESVRGRPAASMCDEIFETVRAFAGENPPSDDATLVVFTRNGLSA